ncbi:MAG: T9SS type A sorting domain-containing protein, partial [Paludibacteraceae bacterium]|nr:T9SS type A sorting domain-containing protein [Paludibacteraceae bacterium]
PVALNDESVRLTIYPNPTTDFVNIDINEEVNSIKIYDISGRIIRSFVNEVNNLYLGDLNKGVYIIQVQTENKLYQNQLVLY